MTHLPRFFSLAFIAAALATPALAQASTEPLTPEELTAASDLVVRARGVEATCDGAPTPEPGNESVTLTPYVTTLEVLEVLKGVPGSVVEVRGTSVHFEGEESSCDETPAPVQQGFVGTFYLVSISGGSYEIAHWSGVEQSELDVELSAVEALPLCSAEPPPDEEEEEEELDEEENADFEDHDCGVGGCSAAGGPVDSGLGWLAALVIAPLFRRRRAR